MQKICINCNYIGKETYKYSFLIIPGILTYLGLQFVKVFMLVSLFKVLGGIVFIAIGLYSLIIFVRNKEQCPNCNGFRTMIPVDTPHAKRIIEKHNLTIPDQLESNHVTSHTQTSSSSPFQSPK